MGPGRKRAEKLPELVLGTACSLFTSPMSKHNAGRSRRPRKRRRAGASYGEVNLDSSDEHPEDVEEIRVWKITTSETTGRVSATRKNHRHPLEYVSEPRHDEPPPSVEETSTPALPEPSEVPPAKVVPKRRRVRLVKENDSVSFLPMNQCQSY